MDRQILSASTMIGDEVRNVEGEDLGNLEEIMIDIDSGSIAYAVLSFGGFLGMPNKLFAIPWDALTLDPDEKVFIIDVDKETLENAPAFDKNHWPDMSDKEWGKNIYSYYGFSPYWERERF
jgi:sporulation protein YlmC with PRC-barrel domain